MWPKLLELLPHLTRLVPMLERYLASRQVKDQANEEKLTALTEIVRGDLGQVTAAHAGSPPVAARLPSTLDRHRDQHLLVQPPLGEIVAGALRVYSLAGMATLS